MRICIALPLLPDPLLVARRSGVGRDKQVPTTRRFRPHASGSPAHLHSPGSALCDGLSGGRSARHSPRQFRPAVSLIPNPNLICLSESGHCQAGDHLGDPAGVTSNTSPRRTKAMQISEAIRRQSPQARLPWRPVEELALRSLISVGVLRGSSLFRRLPAVPHETRSHKAFDSHAGANRAEWDYEFEMNLIQISRPKDRNRLL